MNEFLNIWKGLNSQSLIVKIHKTKLRWHTESKLWSSTRRSSLAWRSSSAIIYAKEHRYTVDHLKANLSKRLTENFFYNRQNSLTWGIITFRPHRYAVKNTIYWKTNCTLSTCWDGHGERNEACTAMSCKTIPTRVKYCTRLTWDPVIETFDQQYTHIHTVYCCCTYYSVVLLHSVGTGALL